MQLSTHDGYTVAQVVYALDDFARREGVLYTLAGRTPAEYLRWLDTPDGKGTAGENVPPTWRFARAGLALDDRREAPRMGMRAVGRLQVVYQAGAIQWQLYAGVMMARRPRPTSAPRLGLLPPSGGFGAPARVTVPLYGQATSRAVAHAGYGAFGAPAAASRPLFYAQALVPLDS